MWYLALGFFLGFLLNFIQIFNPSSGIEIYPEWHGPINQIKNIEKSPNNKISDIKLSPVIMPDSISILSGDGILINRQATGDKLTSVSGSGKYYAAYDKTGTKIEFFDTSGAPFWKMSSQGYPHLSYNGELVLLASSNQSAVRLIDYHGNPVGVKEINGQFATIISFSKMSDFAGTGFLDGSYYIMDKTGDIIARGTAPGGSLIKNIAISNSGGFAAIHYGNEKDFIRIIRVKDKKERDAKLTRVHLARSAMHIADDGTTAVIDYNKILIFGNNAKVRQTIKLPQVKAGAAYIVNSGNLYAAAYCTAAGEAQFLLFDKAGNIFFRKSFPGESFLSASIADRLILLRGSEHLYCYSYLHQ